MTLVPRAGWRDPDVRQVVRRAVCSMAQAGLLAGQILLLLAMAGQVAGGTVALQMSLNFYYLPLAIAAAPVGLALLPRLSRMIAEDRASDFADAYQRAVGLALFLVVPAALGYVVLAVPLANVVAVGQMSSAGWRRHGGRIAERPGARDSWARRCSSSPRRRRTREATRGHRCARWCCRASSAWRSSCLPVSSTAAQLVTVLGGAFAVASMAGGVHLSYRVSRGLAPATHRLWPSVVRTISAGLAMAAVAWSVAAAVTATLEGTSGWLAATAAGTLAGAAVYLGVHRALGSVELTWLLDGARGGRTDSRIEPGMMTAAAYDCGSAVIRIDRSDRVRALLVLLGGFVVAAGTGVLAGTAPLMCLGLLARDGPDGGRVAASGCRRLPGHRSHPAGGRDRPWPGGAPDAGQRGTDVLSRDRPVRAGRCAESALGPAPPAHGSDVARVRVVRARGVGDPDHLHGRSWSPRGDGRRDLRRCDVEVLARLRDRPSHGAQRP